MPNETMLDLPFGPQSLALDSDTERLRAEALQAHLSDRWSLPETLLCDAAAWRDHQPDEPWLVWRARRTCTRLLRIPLAISAGERIAGRPLLRSPAESDQQALADARKVLASMPAFPGGDAGHFHPDFDTLFSEGIGGMRRRIDSLAASATGDGSRDFYRAAGLALDGVSHYCQRVGDECATRSTAAGDSLDRVACICRKVSHEPPESFHEAVQLMFLVIVALWYGEDHVMTAPGRLDRTLRPFYEADLSSGRITRDDALDLITQLYIQLNRILAPGFALSVMVGGRDERGNDTTNELTYLCLAARMATGLSYPTIGLAWHEQTPNELTDLACHLITTGLGDPAFFNDELIVAGLEDNGVRAEDAGNYMNSTCVEIKVVGASNIWVTAPYINCADRLLRTIQLVAAGDLPAPKSYDEFESLVQDRLEQIVARAAEQLDQTWRARSEYGCFPLASCFTADCLSGGQDLDRGGARYNWVENSFVGLANLVDGLAAIEHLVFETGEYTLAELHEILERDFEGHEDLRQRILHRIPCYGNDDEGADRSAAKWATFLMNATESQHVGPHHYVPGFFCWVMHERLGSETGATPDGRKAGTPLADGAGAAQGRDQAGPTASVLATTGWSHRRALGGLVHNVKFAKGSLARDKDLTRLRALIETYLGRGGFEIQVNVLDAAVLRDAQRHPEKYADLLVRVAGYSDYFVHLPRGMQDEVIARTEHALP